MNKSQSRYGAQRADTDDVSKLEKEDLPEAESSFGHTTPPNDKREPLQVGIDIPIPRAGPPLESAAAEVSADVATESNGPVFKVAPKHAVTSKKGILDQGTIVTQEMLGADDANWRQLIAKRVIVQS